MLNWIISSSVLILAIIILRKIFKGKISLGLQYGLWLLVAIRLLVPGTFGTSSISIEYLTDSLVEKLPGFVVAEEKVSDLAEEEASKAFLAEHKLNREIATSVESGFAGSESIRIAENMPTNLQTVTEASDTMEETIELVTENNEIVELAQADTLESLWAEGTKAVPSVQNLPEYGRTTEGFSDGKEVLMYLWIAGVVFMGMVFVLSNRIFCRRIKRNRKALENGYTKLPVFVSKLVETPCLFGIPGAQIYITEDVACDETLLCHSICHEMTHYRHGDLVWSLIRCICLVLHWYNPLVWWAAILSKQDAELLCDEATIMQLGEPERKAYGKTLIQLTCKKPQTMFVASTTMSAGKKNVRERVIHISRKPKTRIYAMVLVLALSLTTVGCTFTEADVAKDTSNHQESMTEEVISEQNEAESVVSVVEKFAEETKESFVTQEKVAGKERYDEKGRRIITLYDTHKVLNIERGFYEEFNRTNKEYKVEIIDSEKYPLASLVNGDNCPDLILTLDWENIGYWQEKGYLADLTPYLDASDVLKKENLLEESLELFRVGDEIYGLPQSMILETMLVSESLMNGATQWTVDAFLDWLEENPQLTVTGGPVNRKAILEYCLVGNLDAYVDLEQGTAAFYPDEFGSVLERIKNLKIDEMDDVYFLELQQGATCLVNQTICCGCEIGIVESLTGDKFVPIGYPNDKGEVRSNILSSKTFAILQNSSCKEGAVAFIESYFAEEVEDRAERNYYDGFLYTLNPELEVKGTFPYNTCFTYSSSSEDNNDIKKEYTIKEEHVDMFLGLYEGAQVDAHEKANLRRLILGVADEYFRCNKPLEKTCEEIQKVVTEFVEEKEA